MSELGMNEHGMISTAAEFHDEYIRNGTVYKDFSAHFVKLNIHPKRFMLTTRLVFGHILLAIGV